MVFIDWATHMLQRQKQKDAKKKFIADLKKLSQSGLCIVTHAYEVEIVSNHKSLCYGE